MNSAGRYFDEHQRRTIETAMARIIPADHQPGAREAGTVDFIDRYLSGIDFVYAKPDGSGFERLEGKVADAWRQRIATLRTRYEEGILALDRRGNSRFGADFHALAPEKQDEVLRDIERGAEAEEAAIAAGQAVVGWSPPEPGLQQTMAETDMDFFPMLVFHTRQGFYADPIYGGNLGRAGWDVIGFPGPSSLAEAHEGRYSTLPWFVEGAEEEMGARSHGAG